MVQESSAFQHIKQGHDVDNHKRRQAATGVLRHLAPGSYDAKHWTSQPTQASPQIASKPISAINSCRRPNCDSLLPRRRQAIYS